MKENDHPLLPQQLPRPSKIEIPENLPLCMLSVLHRETSNLPVGM